MARTKEFDVERALDAAIGVFWQHGFDGTSTDMLLKAMSIGRQSLYDTFGDKRELFIAALRKYVTDSTSELVTMLARAPSPRDGLSDVLVHFAKRAASDARGCFGTNATCELGTSDPEVSSVLEGAAAIFRSALCRAIDTGKARGELDGDIDTRVAARFVEAQLAGLRVAARAGADTRTLTNIAEFALRSFDRRTT
ncbi:MAG: TetR/AcrR family transcriptional regulator [Polyangiaceae bacterium]|nr:TetR/AcrR family transcriptional regulator [Polyangiaceae bacterium]